MPAERSRPLDELPRRHGEGPAEDTGERHELDYELADWVVAETPEQLKALGDETRMAILDLLLERAATVGHLATALDRAKGTVDYHVGILREAGLVQVVRTRKVRAVEERFYGRTGRTIVFGGLPHRAAPMWMVERALREVELDADRASPIFTLRHARISAEQVEAFVTRLVALATEFLELPRRGPVVYGLLAGVYPTGLASLPDDDAISPPGGDE